MASELDLQELLRLLTKRKMTMMAAMGQAKSLRDAGLRSIREIAGASPELVETAIKDAKSAKSLQVACRKWTKDAQKRAAEDGATLVAHPAKRVKQYDKDPTRNSRPEDLEKSLELPIRIDEASIASAAVFTNRAPLLMAFSVQLLRYTMPEQPPSSRLSLAQAVVSTASRVKAAQLGIGKDPTPVEDSWTSGQPRVTVMGRSIAVLRRSGYTWRGDELVQDRPPPTTASAVEMVGGDCEPVGWVSGPEISLKGSTFVAHAVTINESSQRPQLIGALLRAHPRLKEATHNAWAFRIEKADEGSRNRVFEEHDDDGETGCGALMNRVLRDASAFNTLVVISRWFGGVLLGPDRWRLMKDSVQGALAARWRRSGMTTALDGEAVWALDPEGQGGESTTGPFGVVGATVYSPELARSYLIKSFSSTDSSSHRGVRTSTTDNNHGSNLELVLGAVELVLDSWADYVTASELDRKAWAWYVAVRPDVAAGPGGWGGKGTVQLASILKLRRNAGAASCS